MQTKCHPYLEVVPGRFRFRKADGVSKTFTQRLVFRGKPSPRIKAIEGDPEKVIDQVMLYLLKTKKGDGGRSAYIEGNGKKFLITAHEV